MMGQLLVRDLDDEVIRRLKRRAAANGRSTEAEHRAILEQAVRGDSRSLAAAALRFRQEINESGPDSTAMIREQREQRSNSV
jgi:plasmid stability protein